MGRKYRLKRNGKIVGNFDSRLEIDDYVLTNYPDAIWNQGSLKDLEVVGQKPPEKPKLKPEESTLDYVSRKLNDFKKEAISTVTADWGHRVSNANKYPRAMDAVESGGNIAGGLIAGAAALPVVVEAAPAIYSGTKTALSTAGQALTPSTWIGGAFRAAGTLAPNWLLNGADLGASIYFANEAGKDIDRNGLNWETGINAALSLAPFTRDEKAIEGVANALKKPMSSVSSVVNDFRTARDAVSGPEIALSRALNNSIKNTLFTNIPVEHVSSNGITKGSALDVGKEGIHFSPEGSSTTTNIQQTTGYPFVRTGTWTFSNNTKPVEVLDLGYFGKGFNPDFDAKVNNGITNFSYTNNFEGKGNTSYLTMEPSWGLLLSKNISPRVLLEALRRIKRNLIVPQTDNLRDYLQGFKSDDIRIRGEIGDSNYGIYVEDDGSYKVHIIDSNFNERKKLFESFKDLEQFLKLEHEDYLKSLSPLQRTAYLERPLAYRGKDGSIKRPDLSASSSSLFRRDIKLLIEFDINNFYMSQAYKNRFLSKPGGFAFYPKLKQSLLEVKSITEPSSFNDPTGVVLGHSLESDLHYNTLGINVGIMRPARDYVTTITHEFGHGMYRPHLVETKDPLYFIINANLNLIGDPLQHLNPGVPKDDFTLYISNPNELRLRIIPYIRLSFEEGLTPEETYDLIRDKDLKNTFKKDYIIKLIGGILSAAPILKSNDKSS